MPTCSGTPCLHPRASCSSRRLRRAPRRTRRIPRPLSPSRSQAKQGPPRANERRTSPMLPRVAPSRPALEPSPRSLVRLPEAKWTLPMASARAKTSHPTHPAANWRMQTTLVAGKDGRALLERQLGSRLRPASGKHNRTPPAPPLRAHRVSLIRPGPSVRRPAWPRRRLATRWLPSPRRQAEPQMGRLLHEEAFHARAWQGAGCPARHSADPRAAERRAQRAPTRTRCPCLVLRMGRRLKEAPSRGHRPAHWIRPRIPVPQEACALRRRSRSKRDEAEDLRPRWPPTSSSNWPGR